MEARGLFEAVADGKAKAFTVRTLCPDLAHIRLVERPQRVEDVLRLRALIVARTEGWTMCPSKSRVNSSKQMMPDFSPACVSR